MARANQMGLDASTFTQGAQAAFHRASKRLRARQGRGQALADGVGVERRTTASPGWHRAGS